MYIISVSFSFTSDDPFLINISSSPLLVTSLRAKYLIVFIYSLTETSICYRFEQVINNIEVEGFQRKFLGRRYNYNIRREVETADKIKNHSFSGILDIEDNQIDILSFLLKHPWLLQNQLNTPTRFREVDLLTYPSRICRLKDHRQLLCNSYANSYFGK